jgi:hypothetical protein
MRADDGGTIELPGAKETVLSALLRLHLSSPTAGIKKATYELVYNSLLDSSLFQRAEREIDVWLQRLTSEAIPFVETALLQASEEPYTFIDKINSITSVMHSDEFARLSIISAAQSEDGSCFVTVICPPAHLTSLSTGPIYACSYLPI